MTPGRVRSNYPQFIVGAPKVYHGRGSQRGKIKRRPALIHWANGFFLLPRTYKCNAQHSRAEQKRNTADVSGPSGLLLGTRGRTGGRSGYQLRGSGVAEKEGTVGTDRRGAEKKKKGKSG